MTAPRRQRERERGERAAPGAGRREALAAARTHGNFSVRLLRRARPAPAPTIRAGAGVAPQEPCSLLRSPPAAAAALPARPPPAQRRLVEPPPPARLCAERAPRAAAGPAAAAPSTGGARCERCRLGPRRSHGEHGQRRAGRNTQVQNPGGAAAEAWLARVALPELPVKTTDHLFKCTVYICHYYNFVPVPGELTVQVLNYYFSEWLPATPGTKCSPQKLEHLPPLPAISFAKATLKHTLAKGYRKALSTFATQNSGLMPQVL